MVVVWELAREAVVEVESGSGLGAAVEAESVSDLGAAVLESVLELREVDSYCPKKPYRSPSKLWYFSTTQPKGSLPV